MSDIIILQNTVEKYYKMAEKHYDRKFPRPVVKLSNRMSSTAGTARSSFLLLGYDIITFSNPIYNLNSKTEFKKTTVPHEVAHLIEFHRYGTMGHGRHFNFIMRTIFGDTRQGSLRCHSFKTKPRKSRVVTRYNYECVTCGEIVKLTSGQHTKMFITDDKHFTHRCDGKSYNHGRLRNIARLRNLGIKSTK